MANREQPFSVPFRLPMDIVKYYIFDFPWLSSQAN